MAKYSPRQDRIYDYWFTGNCKTGKRCYVDRASAKAAAKQQQKRGMGNMRPYECPFCDRIHIGHQTRRLTA
jgi:hypothetical protein